MEFPHIAKYIFIIHTIGAHSALLYNTEVMCGCFVFTTVSSAIRKRINHGRLTGDSLLRSAQPDF